MIPVGYAVCPRSIAIILTVICLRRAFHLDWLSTCRNAPNATYLALTGPRRRGLRIAASSAPTASSASPDLAHIVYQFVQKTRRQSGQIVYIMALASEVSRSGAGMILVNALIERERESTLFFALTLPGSEKFWKAAGFVVCDDKALRTSLLPGEDPENKALPLVIRHR